MKKLISMIMLVPLLLVGCGTYKVFDKDNKLVSHGETYGFCRDQVVIEKYDNKTGKCIMRFISSKTNIGEYMKYINELVDTGVTTFGKLK